MAQHSQPWMDDRQRCCPGAPRWGGRLLGRRADRGATHHGRRRDRAGRFAGQGDLVLVALPDVGANCFIGNLFVSSAPSNLHEAVPCDAAGTGDVTTGALDVGAYFQLVSPTPAPRGPSQAPKQPEMPRAATAPPEPATDVDVDVDVDGLSIPAG